MTRLASILGVATVATLVLLSGCETMVQKDYAKDLDGIWKSVDLERMVHSVPTDTASPLVAVTTSVTATITAGDEKNTGTFMLAVTYTVAAMQQIPSISVNGTFTVDSSTITLTVTGPSGDRCSSR